MRKRIAVCPAFRHKVTFRIQFLSFGDKPLQEFDILFVVSGVIGCHRIQTEAMHTMIKPEFHNIRNLASDFFTVQIEIRHFRPESRFIIPVCIRERCIAISGISAEVVIVKIRTVLRRSFPVFRQLLQIFMGFSEPFMSIRCVVEHQISDDFDSSLITFFDQCIKIIHRSVFGIDVFIVIDIIFVIGIGRAYRHQPDFIEAKIFNIIQF